MSSRSTSSRNSPARRCGSWGSRRWSAGGTRTAASCRPAVFIPLAEECGLIVAIGRKVLEQACALAAAWRPRCRVAVNLSPVQFRDGSLPELVAGNPVPHRARRRPAGTRGHRGRADQRRGAGAGQPARAENAGRAGRARRFRHRLFEPELSSAAFRSTGSRSTRAFVQAQAHDDGTRAILEAVLAMSSRLHLAVTAEGVETEEQLQVLRELGCAEVQGFLLARPMPSADVQAFLLATDGGVLSRRVSPSVIPVSAHGVAAVQVLVPARAA